MINAMKPTARSAISFPFDIGAIVSKDSPLVQKVGPVSPPPQATIDVIRHPTRLYE
jgi:hypothetical protein